MQATQQSKMIQQRQTDGTPIDFENDTDANIANLMQQFVPQQ